MIPHTLDMILTVVVLSFWFLFPIGMFLSVAHVDKNTHQVIDLDKLRHDSEEPQVIAEKKTVASKKPRSYKGRPTLLPH